MNKTKQWIGVLGIALGGALSESTSYGQPSVAIGVSVPLPSVEIRVESDFYEPLTPQGEWVVVGSYGRCWRPVGVAVDWRPYCNGNWVRTDAGWYWASDEPWGWATYHYGRWDFTDQYGWYWVPQVQWAPAWVSWHEGGGYVGWAPLQPAVRISASGYVGFNVALIPPRAFVFVEHRQFLEPIRPRTVVVNNTTIISKTVNVTNTKIVNNTVINEGPATAVIEQASGKKVQPVAVKELRQKAEAAVVGRQRAPAAKSEASKPVPATGESKTAVKPDAKSSDKPDAKTPARPETKPSAKPDGESADKKEQPPAKENPAARGRSGANPSDKDPVEKAKE